MRVATFNILHGASPVDGRVDADRFADAVARLDADVLALQEVDRDQDRSGGTDLAAVAAGAMGAVDHRFVAAMVGRPDGWVPAVEEQAGWPAYGIAVASRFPVVSWKVLRLPTVRGRAPYLPPGERRPRLVREEARVALAAVLDTPTGRRTVVNTHLSFVPWANRRQVRTLADALPVLPQPALLVGDLNMSAERAERLTGLTSVVRARTFPAERPLEQLDHVLSREPLPDAAGEAVLLPLSDHRALVVDV